MQANVKDRVSLDAIIAANLVCDSELHRLAGIPEEIEEGLQVSPRDSHDGDGFTRAKLRVERRGYAFGGGDLKRRNEMEPGFFVIVLCAHAHQLRASGIIE